ncbi:SHOCT domain-containing protein [Halobaculum sp. MBLA0143]|uniref:SHOCT domain-containing protein n=1 Tax=Halobaculum sp. MBLA0143 TaxID=3079933 RepID=UPI00352358EE
MTRPPDDDPDYHALIEHYTPDGALGRLLFGLLVGSVGAGTALIGLAGVFAGTVSAFLVGVAGLLVGVPLFVVGLAALWPVYLSVIGNLREPAAYGVGDGLETPEADPEEILQRRYAAGELTREEFERRLDDVFAAREAPGERVTADDAPDEERLQSTRREARRRRERESEGV